MASQSIAVAVVAMTGRFPGASSVETLWSRLRQGKHSIQFYSRRELEEGGVSPAEIANPLYVPAAAPIEGPDLFDAEYFGYSDREAESIDPQQRVFLQTAVHALESAAIDPARPPGRIGVFAGSALSPYLLYHASPLKDSAFSKNNMAVGSAVDKDYVATRVSYKLDLRGPSVTVQTACSTSLVAVHMACRSLMAGDCDVALAGGVSVLLGNRRAGYLHTPGGVLSADGLCRPFDALASGTVFGDGVGVVVLQRLEDAEASGADIWAVIRGSAINNDGGSKLAFAAPSAVGQAAVIEEALASAGLISSAIDYVEAHGTGTPVGDRIEVRALGRVWSRSGSAGRPCLLGSIKSNIGHLNTAAGIAGFIKAVLVARHGIVPATAHFERPHKTLPLDTDHFAIPNESTELPSMDRPRRTSVSSFGIGGTNAHVVIEQYRPRRPIGARRGPRDATARRSHLLPVSAKTGSALTAIATAVVDCARTGTPEDVAQLALSLGDGRTVHALRQFILLRENGDVERSAVVTAPARRSGAAAGTPVVVLLSDLGFDVADVARLARRVAATHPIFAVEFEACVECAVRASFQSADARLGLEAALNAGLPGLNAAIFAAFCFAATRQLQQWGVQPAALAGLSLGEYVAAGVSGALGREDMMNLVTRRAELMALVPEGAMVAVPLSASAVFGRHNCDLELAVSSGADSCVLSGPKIRVEAFKAELERSGVHGVVLDAPYAVHSRGMLAVRKPCEDLFRGVAFGKIGIPFVSGVTGNWHTDETLTPSYWGRHLTETMRFDDGLRLIVDAIRPKTIIQLGRGRGLERLVRDILGDDSTAVIEPFSPDTGHVDDGLLDAVGKVWQLGGEIRWSEVAGAGEGPRAAVPAYPFECRSYWLDNGRAASDMELERSVTDIGS
jgi:phthiocerol/phenolphthiocerol synthesis type-I polyketide synthase E